MKKLYYLIILTLILGLVLTGCSLLSNISQVPATEQSGITYLTKQLLPSNLVALWHFDDDADDSSGNLNHGSLMGDTSWTSGKFGNALSFDGDGDYVQLPASNTILDTDTFTIEAWFKTSVNHPAEGKEGRLITLYKSATASTALSLYVEKDKIGLLYYNGTAHVWMKFTVNYHDDVWHHIAVTYDAITYNLYYDGTKVESWDDDFGWFGACPASLGDYISSERFFNGLIDEVRIWNEALGPDAILQSYELSGAQSSSPCVVQLSHQVLTSGEVICFTSAFYLSRQIQNMEKSVDIYIMSASGGRTIGDIDFRHATPAKTEGFMVSSTWSGTQGTALVNNGPAMQPKDKTSTSIHLYAELNTTERLGVNAQYLPWD